ncbi:alpha carbonic anhydrase [Pseudomassariella vexata]|uniref:carbonic anhydrase n=1 Tax=Pseudomassariella vexata TaxID=1141098 RepID=A0A1Y2E6P7_9PEZI|nr:alpha carbonic anhydrase [Pseudomassariella vexata]ORY67253.1 alpha carbonic anhydrase [Pseudomassariella vexata]
MLSSILELLLVAASVTPALGFCGSHTHLQRRAEEGEAVPISTFGYIGDIGPHNWAALDAANSACATGTRQSPINMVEGQFQIVAGTDVTLTIPDQTEGIEFENLGTTVEGVMEGSGATMVLNGEEYELMQFHFHHPSEHLDNGTSIAMEMHMVFQTAEEQLAVIGVYVDLDTGVASAAAPAAKRRHPQPDHSLWKKQAEAVSQMQITAAADNGAVTSTMLETLFQSVEEIATPGTKVTTQPLIMSELVETLKLGNFEAYSGSLTTPPCSEGVNWMVATQRVQISTASFERVRNVVKFNSRFTQNALGSPNVVSLSAGAAAVAEPVAAA